MLAPFIIPAIGGLVAMDTTGGPQVFISEPLVSCTLVGLAFGMPEAGLMCGLLFQLLWFGYLPLGAVRLIDGNMGALTGTSSLFLAAHVFGFDRNLLVTGTIPALLIGVVAGLFGMWLTTYERSLNARRSDRLIAHLSEGVLPGIRLSHAAGILNSFIRGAVMTIILVPAGALLCGTMIFLPLFVVRGFAIATTVVWGAVCAAAISVYLRKGARRQLASGILIGLIILAVRLL